MHLEKDGLGSGVKAQKPELLGLGAGARSDGLEAPGGTLTVMGIVLPRSVQREIGEDLRSLQTTHLCVEDRGAGRDKGGTGTGHHLDGDPGGLQGLRGGTRDGELGDQGWSLSGSRRGAGRHR